MEEIIANSEEKPLPELPMNEHLNPNRKPTEAEKEKFEVFLLEIRLFDSSI
jgi:hypothetical protein